MNHLRYLVEEVAVGLEIYCAGRTGAHTLKSAFLLCDDYTELASKLFLVQNVAGWSDLRAAANPKSGFKNYHQVLDDVRAEFVTAQRSTMKLDPLHERMRERRDRRNDFFHSTNLLDLSVSQSTTAQGFVDLLDYGGLLFADWSAAIAAAPRGMETLETITRLDVQAIVDPSTPDKVNRVLRSQPKNVKRAGARGAHIAEHPADLHTMLCVIWGGSSFRDELKKLLRP